MDFFLCLIRNLGMGSCLSVDETTGEIGCTPVFRAKRKEKKKQLKEALAAEAETMELLSQLTGRMLNNGARGRACMFTQKGKKGTNQDAMVVWENFASQKDTIFCGVFDGHGPYGHLVARRVRDILPWKLMVHWKARMRGEDESCVGLENCDLTQSKEFQQDCNGPETFLAWSDCFLKAYDGMDKDLRTHTTIDCVCSGTTAVTMLIQGQDLMIGNVGDSRAILGTRRDDDTLEAIQLTVDLKPNLPIEAERIRRFKGRVFALDDEPEVARIWLPHDDSPGLAMARAFGDFCLKDFGLIAVPMITYRRLTERDQFIVLASDGVWDVLSNQQVVDLVSSAPTKATAARTVVEIAVRAWKLKYPTSKVDDCAVVCVYLNYDPPSSDLQPESTKKTSDATLAAAQRDVLGEYKEREKQDGIRELNGFNNVTGSSIDKPLKMPKEKRVEKPLRTLAECLATEDDDEWSALDGVTRVNSLLNLPRFLMGDKREARI